MKIFYLLLITILFIFIQSKTSIRQFGKSQLQSGQKRFFLTKFDFGTNGGSIRIKAMKRQRQNQQKYLIIDAVIDDFLDQYSTTNCQERKQFVLRSQQMTFAPSQLSDERKIKIHEQTHQHIHYLYLVICDQNIGQLIDNQNQRIVLQISLYNDQSHFGEDQKFLLGYLILVTAWVGYMIKYAGPVGRAFFSSNDKTKQTVFSGLIILGVAYFYRLIHLGIYYSNGKGLYFFEILYIILKSACQFIIVTVLVSISWGWSITHLRHDQSYILAGATATLINIVGLIVNVSAEQMVDNHHKYDSTSGYILQILRFLILLIFIIGIIRTLTLSVGNIKKFIKKVGIVGGVYLASWPLTVLFAQVCLPNYMHNQIITFVQQITHLIATGILCHMLAHPQSSYRKVSIKEEDNPLKMQNYKRK